jgi:hypothetical protein
MGKGSLSFSDQTLPKVKKQITTQPVRPFSKFFDELPTF